MRAVLVGVDFSAVGAEVIAVDVVDEAVAVVVDAGQAVELGLVDGNMGGEVLVGVVDTEGVAELPTKKLSKSLNFHKLRLFYVHKIL